MSLTNAPTFQQLTRPLSLLAAIVLALATGPLAADEPHTFTGETMGTSYTIRVTRLPGEVDANDLLAAIERRLERVNDQMSTWRPDSELSRFNRHRGTDWFAVSRETAAVIAAAIRIGHQTEGAFDVTVGPLVNLWQFGPEERTGSPTDEELAAALERVGYQQLEARLDPPAVRKSRPDLYVDLSGIAKGFGVDEVARLFDEQGTAAYMVEIGGEIRTRGKKPDGTGWKIGIEAPLVGRRTLHRTVELSGQSLATSGDYRNFREVDGRMVSHTIDPRTGRPTDHRLASVTVVAETCMEADAWATALMVFGPERAYNWALEQDLAALLIIQQADGFVERATPLFTQSFPVENSGAGSRSGSERRGRGLPMETFLFTLIVFVVAVAAMAVGVLFGKRRLRGTCGGLANLRDSAGRSMCDACHDPSPACGGVEEGRQRAAAAGDSQDGSESNPPRR